MMNIILVIIIVYLIGVTLILGFDILVYMIERYSHFHIGRWKSIDKWSNAIEKTCRRWVVRTPILRLKKECRYLLVDRITGKYGKKMVQSWQKAGLLLGLDENHSNQVLHDKIKKQLLDTDGSWKIKPEKIDYSMMAYALLKEERQPETIRLAMDTMIEIIEKNLCNDGLVSYSGGKETKRRYVDTLGFICPFLGLYGITYKKPEYVKMAIQQILIFSEHGLYQGLPYHCYETNRQLPIGVLGWGRGTGWYTLAMIDLYDSVSDENEKSFLEKLIMKTADTIIAFERQTGGFSSIITVDTPYDSSATAMLGYFFAKCGLIFCDDIYTVVAERCVRKLMRETKINGVIDNCQGDTIDVGIFSERYAEMPFAQGITLRLIKLLNI